jgi:hypothetical protein
LVDVANLPAEHIRHRPNVGRGLGTTTVLPGVNEITVPIAIFELLICVVVRWVVAACWVLVVLVCANAKGATIAQARTIVVRLMCSLSLS